MYTESDGKLNRSLATRVINIAACVCVCVRACVSCVRACVCVHVWEGEVTSLIALYVKLKLLYLSESPEVPLVSVLVLAMYASLSSI